MLALISTDIEHQKTIIVLLLSLIANWEKELQKHCLNYQHESILDQKTASKLRPKKSNGNIFFISLAVLCRTFKNNKDCELFCYQWHRIVLDEGHCICNSKTISHKACCAVKAQCHWIITGKN